MSLKSHFISKKIWLDLNIDPSFVSESLSTTMSAKPANSICYREHGVLLRFLLMKTITDPVFRFV